MARTRKTLPSQEELRQLFEYDASTGVLRWKYRPDQRSQWNNKFVGKVAGAKGIGQISVSLGHGNLFRASRIIWKMVHNEEPHVIDHKNCDPFDNRLENLRPATNENNCWNSRGWLKRKGLKGAYFHKLSKLWTWRILCNGVLHCGYCKTERAAHLAYVKKAKELFGEFARAA